MGVYFLMQRYAIIFPGRYLLSDPVQMPEDGRITPEIK